MFVYDETTNREYYLHDLNTGSCINLVNSVLNYESLFTIKTSCDCILFEIEYDDILYISQRNEALNVAVNIIISKFILQGIKYDFFRFIKSGLKVKDNEKDLAKAFRLEKI